MLIIGCDFHSRFQQIAMADTETGELIERRLEHKRNRRPSLTNRKWTRRGTEISREDWSGVWP